MRLFKVGGKVRIKSLDWYNANKDEVGYVEMFNCNMSTYCGKEAIITHIYSSHYIINLDNGKYWWNDKMFENMEQNKIILPEGWEIDKVEGNEVILKESKKELPKTWRECLKLLTPVEYITSNGGICLADYPLANNGYKNSIPLGLGKPMLTLMQLLVCREVYRQGWKPDYSDGSIKYCIKCYKEKIGVENYSGTSCILSFQSEEVRDEFLENFRGLIEEAKELI